MTATEIDTRLPNYIRVHRRRAGLSQDELSQALGYGNAQTVARHERLHATPPLGIAIRYELIFRIPISELFAGLHDEVASDVEASLARLKDRLEQQSARDRYAIATAQKLVWLSERKKSEHEYVP
jgi:DNA-binding XRE family transcriptional regulator